MRSYNIDPFYALADPSRREILLLVSKEKCNINTLADNFNVSRPAVSKHVKILCDAGFIKIEDIGRERYCELNPDGFNEVKRWVTFFEQFWQEKIGNLENLLKSRSKQKNKRR